MIRFLRVLAIVLVLCAICLGARAQSDVLFQDFYWDTVAPAGQSWWTYTASQLPALARAGIGAVWVPAPYKGGVGKLDMGYGPYDLYDLGSKDQKGTVATHFGTKEQFLAFVADAHRLGIKVYADAVLNHASGADYAEPNPVMAKLGWDDIPDDSKVPAELRSPSAKPGDNLRSWTGFAPKGADGKLGTGRFPRTWRDFHPNEAEPDRNPPYHQQEFGQDYAFHGDHDYVRKSMIAWSHWFIAQTGVDGYRMDDVKGMEPDFVADFINLGPPGLWVVGEYLDGDPSKLADYLHQAHDSLHLFDYPLYFALQDMTFRPEAFDMHDLFKRRMADRDKAVMFVGNHDMSRNSAVIVYNVPLAYAVIMAMAGTPSVYYSDFWRAGAPLRTAITKLVEAHDELAVGTEITRHVDKTTLVLERKGHLLAAFNSGGDEETHKITVPTSFAPHTRLIDYVGDGKPIMTDDQGRATLQIAPYCYEYYARAGQALAIKHKPIKTSQTWEFADDLDTGRLSGTPQTIHVTLIKGESLNATLTLDGGVSGNIAVVDPNGATLTTSAKHAEIASAPMPGIYALRARSTNGKKVHGTLTVQY